MRRRESFAASALHTSGINRAGEREAVSESDGDEGKREPGSESRYGE